MYIKYFLSYFSLQMGHFVWDTLYMNEIKLIAVTLIPSAEAVHLSWKWLLETCIKTIKY